MIVRRCFSPTAIIIALTLLGGFEASAGERWSRQVSNSEWIPLADPRIASVQSSQDRNTGRGLLPSSTHLPNPIQSLSLPPVLQQQYQDQLLQLQKTQESIQKLLLLQQQLKAQQHLLQSQTFAPSGFSNEDEKQTLPQSSLSNLQTELSPEVLAPPHPSSEALPPVYPPQNFLPHRPGHAQQNLYSNQELSNLPIQGQVVLQHGQNVDDTQEGPHNYVTKHGNQRPDGKRLKGQPSAGLQQPPLIESTGDEEEEVQLVYVPAETLAQRGQPKRGRGRKQYPVRQHYHQREHQGQIEQTALLPDQEAFARHVLQQIQKEHEEKAQYLKEERVKEFARLNEEQKALELKTRLQQEALQREQDLLRQKEADKKRKELDRLEELARQRELDRIREAREKQRQEELERRRLAELRAKEEKRREEEARQREDRQKQLELEQALKQQRILETHQQKDHLRPSGPGLLHQNAQSQALTRDQARRQHLTDGTRPKKIHGRQRQRVNQYQEQPHFREVTTTTPSPNQPPLSVYMGSSTSRQESIKVTDVLRILKDAKTIAVLDTVGPNSPQVFVGPTNLDPPYGYTKFDLPYLSSIDHNRVERKVDKLPFFVAPLSFKPPPGYSKIPFPAPHVGSVVVNTLSDSSPEPDTPVGEQNPNPTPLIEPNSYSDADQSGSIATTASYDTQTFSPESSSPKYGSAYSTPASGSRYRFRQQYYDNKPASVSTPYYGEQSTTKTKPKQYYDHEFKLTTQSPKVDTTVSYREEISYSSTPSFQDRTVNPNDPSTKEQDLAAQLALINQELAQQREAQRYNTAGQYNSQTNLGESYDVNDVRAPVGPTQYNLPAELPPISPHLPGLVNSLLDKQEGNPTVSSTPPTTTTTTTKSTTTTARVSSTTYRPRGRGRVVPTRSRTTTQASANRTTAEKNRRPTYNRSKSRFTTTTESYHESSYEPTKAKTPETTQKYNTEHRRPTSRTHKYRNRDRTSSHSAVLDPNHVQAQHAAGYENYPTQSISQSNASPDAYSPTGGAAPNVHQKDTSSPGVSDFTRENYPSTTPTPTENYPPLREVTIQHGTPLLSNDYSRSQNYPQNRPQEARYPEGATYEQNSNFEQTGLERTPVNGFNYQAANSPDETAPQSSKEYPHYQEKLENANYNLPTTVDPRIRPGEEHQFSPIYETNVAQTQSDYSASKIEGAAVEADANTSPVFIPLQHSKQEDYELQIPSTEAPLAEITTTSTTTPAPVIIRQRVRGRVGTRTHHDSSVQTRPRGSQDEYVRFSAVNHDSARTSHRHREGSRTRVRARPPQSHHGSQVQTEGNEYIKIHGAQQQRLIATTVPSTTTTTTTTAAPTQEDVEYGFIRMPNFRPVNPVHPVPEMDHRFQAPITYRPPLSEIQHIISHDESAVDSSPSHILKTRPTYHHAPNRHPITKTLTTTTTSTTTESIPVATAMPDDVMYTVKPKTKPENPKSRVRGRIRRPGKKRTTTTTESVLEANNELPLDENYPRIMQQLPVTATGQQPIYEENFDISSQFVPNQNRPAAFFEETAENYQPQQFVLNFGELPEQVPQREEYDQTQLASIPSKKYSGHRGNVDTGDIYGAESQWSTKLSRTSFQPSFATNHMVDERVRDRTRGDQAVGNAPEIITAGPEPSSVTVMVFADYQKPGSNSGDMDTMMDVFGVKTNTQDHAEKSNVTAVTSSPSTVPRGSIRNDKETSPEAQDWMRKENSSKEADDSAKVAKKVTDPLVDRKNGTRRRRVRVRVRPISDDFVTAESQHYNPAMNSLVQDQYKYNPIQEFKFTTSQPIATTVTAATATASTETRKSLLQGFLEEMLKNDKVSIPTRVTVATTELPDWTISTPMTTPYGISDDGETTTMGENYTPTMLTPNSKERIHESSGSSKSMEERQTASSEETSRSSQEETEIRKEIKSEEYWGKSSQEDKSEQNNLENSVATFSQEYKLPSNYGSETTKESEDTKLAKLTNFPTASEEIRKLSAINKEKEHIMTLRKQKENVEENEAHPKNHRAKWSEVRYPSAFDKSQSALKLHSTTSIPGIVTRNEGDTSVKTLSDYVKAIFDSMKNADREEEEIAKVVEAVNETPVNNSSFNNVASIREMSRKEIEEGDYRVGTSDSSSQEASTTQRARIKETNAEEAPSITESTTTNESATTFETTTLIPDATTNTIAPSEEMITESSTTTLPTKTTTSIRRTTGGVVRANSTETMLGKILRTSTTTKVSHMTEICYRGRCVMTRPKLEDVMRR